MSDVPHGWVQTTLGAVCASPQYGWTTSALNHATNANSLRFLRTTDITHGPLEWNAVPYCKEDPPQPEKYALATGDIVISRAGSVGFSYRLIDVEPAVFASYLIRFRPSQLVDGRYVAYFLQSPRYWQQVRAAAAGIALANVNAKKLAAIELPLAPRAEQERIVAAIEKQFSRLDAGTVTLMHARQKLTFLRRAVLEAAVGGHLVSHEAGKGSATGLLAEISIEPSKRKRADLGTAPPNVPANWATSPWSSIGRSQNGRAFPSADYSSEGTRLLRPGNLRISGRVTWDDANTRCLPERYAEEFPGYLVGPNEIVINLTAQSLRDEFLGRVCMTGQDDLVLLNQRIARLTPVDGMNARFVFWVLKSPSFRRFVARLNTGSLIQHMFTWQLDQFIFPVPPRAEQDRIVTRVEELMSSLDALERVVLASEARLDPLRSAVLAAAFSGALAAQNPDDERAAVLLERISAELANGKTAKVRQHRRKATA